MGSFSFLKADNLTKVANIVYKAPFKFLIPAEFGGGYIKDYYQDYGYLDKETDKYSILYPGPKYDMHEFLAVWNYKYLNQLFENNESKKVIVRTDSNGNINMMPKISDDTKHNRNIGIDLFFSDLYYKPFIYQLKLVSCSFKGSYEDCEGVSENDPEQGFKKLLRSNNSREYEHMLCKLTNAKKENKLNYSKNHELSEGELLELLKEEKESHNKTVEEINQSIKKINGLIQRLLNELGENK